MTRIAPTLGNTLSQSGRSCGLITALCVLAACTGCFNETPAELAVWSEFLPLDELREHVPTLAEFETGLYLAVRPDDVEGDALWTFLKDAWAADVPVRLWLQLPEQGVWLNEENVTEHAAFARRLVELADEHEAPIEWLIFDLEPDFAYAEALRAAANSGNVQSLLDLLGGHLDAVAFEQATAAVHEIVTDLHDRNVNVMAVTLPWTIDDLADGDADLQDLFDTPLADIPWDQVAVMAYRPVFAELFGVPLSPGYVAGYARSLREAFGSRAHVAVGNISTAGRLVPPGYVDPFDVRRDVSAACSAGIDSMSLFSLDGMLEEGGVRRWLESATTPTPRIPYLDPLADLLRVGLNWADRLIDRFRSEEKRHDTEPGRCGTQ